MSNSKSTSRAQTLATFLNGAWRKAPPELAMTNDELTEIAPLLMGSGAGALAWWRIRETSLSESPAGLELHEAYRLHALHALLFQQRITKAVQILRDAGVEPILIKGWANARLYPETALRPYGDVDLCVSPSDYATAVELLMHRQENRQYLVDLQSALGRLDDRSWDAFYSRSRLVALEDMKVRVLALEDHLHILCVHMLEDGAWRPIQLCDIAVVMECAFDWSLALGPDNKRAKWIASALRLAHELIGARIDHCPTQIRNARVPRWLVSNVMRHWERPCIEDHRPPELIMKTLRHPARLPKAMALRWPDPIGATIRLKGSFNEVPRLPFQVIDYAIKNGRFLKRLFVA